MCLIARAWRPHHSIKTRNNVLQFGHEKNNDSIAFIKTSFIFDEIGSNLTHQTVISWAYNDVSTLFYGILSLQMWKFIQEGPSRKYLCRTKKLGGCNSRVVGIADMPRLECWIDQTIEISTNEVTLLNPIKFLLMFCRKAI